ncbi:MAG: FAD-dependent oxidoreductase [Solirubrobacteraceae bacterium]
MQHKSDSRSRRVDVLLADAGQRQGLVAVRELGKAGLVNCAVDSDRHAPAFSSRWCAFSAVVPDFAEDQDGFVGALLELCAEYEPRVLIPAHDGSLEALRPRRSDLERVVGLALGSERALEVAVDKTLTLAHAQSIGLRIPRGITVKGLEGVEAAVEECELPLVVKPTHTWVQSRGAGQRLRAILASTRAEAIAAAQAILAEGTELVLQEWLPGDREAISFMCAHDRIWARFAQRADRTFPPLGGNSVLRESIPLPPDITPAAEQLVLEIGLDGYSEVEFRRDANGRAALMEINPRLSASVEIATRAGVPFPQLLYAWANGESLEEVGDYRLGRRMRWLGGDLPWLEQALRQPDQPDVPSRVSAASAFLTDFLKPMGYDYLDRGDPRPALAATAGAMRQLRSRATRFKWSTERRARVSKTFAGGLDTDVAVIGAGPYGMAISAHLSACGVRHEIFGEPMDTWRNHMPAGMMLKSEGFASNISDPSGERTLERYCAERGIEYGSLAAPIHLDTFAGYGCWFQEQAAPGLRANQVDLVRRTADGFELRLDSTETLRARRVVVATGVQGLAYLPPQLSSLPDDAVVHCYDYGDPLASSGSTVAVLGAGQSALEAAALIHEQGAIVHVILRAERISWNSKPGGASRPLRERLRYPESGLGEGMEQRLCASFPLGFHALPQRKRVGAAYGILGPAGSWWLRPRIEGHIDVRCGRTVTEARVEDGGVCLTLQGPTEVEELRVEKVVAGTGYRADLDRLPFLDRALRDSVASIGGIPDAPVLDRWFQSSVADLYFVGHMAAVSFGPLMRFVYGTDFAARRLSRRLS